MHVHLFENKSMWVISHRVKWRLQENALCLSWGFMCSGHTVVYIHRELFAPGWDTQTKSPLILTLSGRSIRPERFPKILKDIKHQLTLVSSSVQFRGYILPLKQSIPNGLTGDSWLIGGPAGQGMTFLRLAPADPVGQLFLTPTAHFLGIHT